MAQSRDSFPDILRGFALLGIAMVNVQYFATDTISGFEGLDLTDTGNSAATFIVMFLFQSKFYLLFSFLFGYSAHYVIKGEKSSRKRWIARSVGLVFFGLVHLVFLFHGDILFVYGVLVCFWPASTSKRNRRSRFGLGCFIWAQPFYSRQPPC